MYDKPVLPWLTIEMTGTQIAVKHYKLVVLLIVSNTYSIRAIHNSISKKQKLKPWRKPFEAQADTRWSPDASRSIPSVSINIIIMLNAALGRFVSVDDLHALIKVISR